MKEIEVTCALITVNNKTLVVQRSEDMKLPLKWEFPGGKIEPGETAEECIKREVKEELNIEIELIGPLTPVRHEYPSIGIKLIPFLARYKDGELQLKEHKQYLIISKNEMRQMDWAEADIPIVNEYLLL